MSVKQLFFKFYLLPILLGLTAYVMTKDFTIVCIWVVGTLLSEIIMELDYNDSRIKKIESMERDGCQCSKK